MDLRKKWITKEEEKMILRTYRLHNREIVPWGDPRDHQYEILPIRRTGKDRAAIISIRAEFNPEKPFEEKSRIIVSHSDSFGKVTFRDIWDRDSSGKLYWRFRNPVKVPISDREEIDNLEFTIEQLAEKVDFWEKKYRHLYNTMVETKPAGRPPHPEKLDEQAAKVKELLNQGLGEKEITEQLQISRATFYRMKKRI